MSANLPATPKSVPISHLLLVLVDTLHICIVAKHAEQWTQYAHVELFSVERFVPRLLLVLAEEKWYLKWERSHRKRNEL